MSSDEIDTIAARWVMRSDRGPLSDDEQGQRDAWLEADPRHMGAFVRAEAAWRHLDRIQALGQTAVGRRDRRPSRRLFLAAAAAASAAVVVGVASPPWPRPSHYATNHGEIRRIPLEDGSVATLNSDSAMSVTLSSGSRRVDLVRGEVWFQVAHNAARPFTVYMGDVSVRAVGTAFSVSRTPSADNVLVTAGVVSTRVSARGPELRQAAGSSLKLGLDGRMRMEAPGVEALNRRLAWRQLQIALNGDDLASAVAQLNQYNTRKLVIVDPELASSRIVGWFRLDDPNAFADAVAVMFQARVVSRESEILIMRGSAGAAGPEA